MMDENNVIITTARVTLDDGETYSVKYMNNSDTLEYMEALVETPTKITLYTFEYQNRLGIYMNFCNGDICYVSIVFGFVWYFFVNGMKKD